jgi:hypothetical protein
MADVLDCNKPVPLVQQQLTALSVHYSNDTYSRVHEQAFHKDNCVTRVLLGERVL